MCCSVVDQPKNSPMNLPAGLMNGLDLPAEFEAAAARVIAAWSRGRSWQRFSLDDVDRLRPAFTLAKVTQRSSESRLQKPFDLPLVPNDRLFRRLWPTWSAMTPNG
jgi:hypothetical protein